MKTSVRQLVVDERLASYIGDNPAHDGEQGGMLHQGRLLPGVDFLMPSSQLRDSLEEFSTQIQKAVNLHENR